MLSVRVLESFSLPDGWSDVGTCKGVNPSQPEATSCHFGLDTIHLRAPDGWHFLESNLDQKRNTRGSGAGFPFPGVAIPQSIWGFYNLRGLLENPFNGMGSVDQELLSIH